MLIRQPVEGVPEKAIFRTVTVYNKNVTCQFNLLAQIEQVQDINYYSDYKHANTE
jgi:hypothetical protein